MALTSPPDARTTAVTGVSPRAAVRRDTVYAPRRPLDLLRTLSILRRGRLDPTMHGEGSVVWCAMRTPHGVATLALRTQSSEIRAAAWGDNEHGAGAHAAEHALDLVPALCGEDDDPSEFNASRHPLIEAAARQHPGLRLTRTGAVFDALAGGVIEQKVTGMQAFGGWRYLVTRYGTAAPGPSPRPLFAAPTPEQWRRIPSWQWHRAGVEPAQSRRIAQLADRGERIEAAVHRAGAGEASEQILRSLPGIGEWTAAEIRIRALGDPDAVSFGDYHLAHEVGYALTGHRTDDDGMRQLLAPWSGHRQRVIRLIRASGVFEPRRGPRLAPENHRNR